MDLDDIKRGLRAEIKKRENEEYATFQCNVRQMCKDVLAKLEEQESEIAELEEQGRHHKYKRCLAMAKWCDSEANYWYDSSKVLQCCRYGHYIRWFNKWSKLAEKFKEAK